MCICQPITGAAIRCSSSPGNLPPQYCSAGGHLDRPSHSCCAQEVCCLCDAAGSPGHLHVSQFRALHAMVAATYPAVAPRQSAPMQQGTKQWYRSCCDGWSDKVIYVGIAAGAVKRIACFLTMEYASHVVNHAKLLSGSCLQRSG